MENTGHTENGKGFQVATCVTFKTLKEGVNAMTKIEYYELNVQSETYQLLPLMTQGQTKQQQYEMRDSHLLRAGATFAAVQIRANAETETAYNQPLDHLSAWTLKKVCEELGGAGALPLCTSNVKDGIFYVPTNEAAKTWTRQLWAAKGTKAMGRGHFVIPTTMRDGVGSVDVNYYEMPAGTRITAGNKTVILHDGSSAADDALFPASLKLWDFSAHRASADVLNVIDGVFTPEIYDELLDGYADAIRYAISDQFDLRRADAKIGQAQAGESQESLFFDERVKTRMTAFLADLDTPNAQTLAGHPFLRSEENKRMAAELFRLTTAGTLESAFSGYGGLIVAADTAPGVWLSERRDVKHAVIVRHPALDSSSIVAGAVKMCAGFAPERAIQTRNQYRSKSGAFRWAKDFLMCLDLRGGAVATTPDGTTITIPPRSVINCADNIKWSEGVIEQGEAVICEYQIVAAISGADCIGMSPADINAMSGADADDLIEVLDLDRKRALYALIQAQPCARVVAKETKREGSKIDLDLFFRQMTPRIVMAMRSGSVISQAHFIVNFMRQMSRKQREEFCQLFFRLPYAEVEARIKDAWQAGLDGGKAQGAELSKAIRLMARISARWAKYDGRDQCGYLRKDPRKWRSGRAIVPFLRLEIPTPHEMGVKGLFGNVPTLIKKALRILVQGNFAASFDARRRNEKKLADFVELFPSQQRWGKLPEEASRLFRLYYQRWSDAKIGLAGYRKAEGDDVAFRYAAEDFNKRFLKEVEDAARQLHFRSKGALTTEAARKRLVCQLWRESHDERRDGSLCWFLFERDLQNFARRAA